MRNRPFLFNGRLFKITISCGLATYPDNAQGAEELLKVADKALYFSKRFGRNTIPGQATSGCKTKDGCSSYLGIYLYCIVGIFVNNYFVKNYLPHFK